MNIQIITSSYPAFKGDPSGTAGLFVQSFAGELASLGHSVVVQPVERKKSYQTDPGIVIEPLPWGGGDQELASMSFLNPWNWFIFLKFFIQGKEHVLDAHKKYHIDRTLCMWVIPCGIFGFWIKKTLKKEYDVWALGSDIWKIKRIPFFGNQWIKKIVESASGVYADGLKLSRDVKAVTQRECQFLASTRVLPKPNDQTPLWEPHDAWHLLFVGRYHKNKGPDLLLEALTLLSDEIRRKIRVHLYGFGDMEERLKEYCLNHNLTSFVNLNGPIQAQELSNRFDQTAYLLIPSRIESIPVIFSDALQRETPVVATPAGDLPNFIKKYGCGILAHDISPRSFARAIEQSLNKKKEDFSSQVHRAYEKFNISRTVKQWLQNERA